MKECKDSNNTKGMMFTERLTKLRQARGWTKKEFSMQIGKTQQTVGKWENGTNAPTFKDLVKLVELFGVTSDYLLGLSDSPSMPTHHLTTIRKNMLVKCSNILMRGIRMLLLTS